MTFSVYQPWDPLKVCIVGTSYPPEFYSYIKNSRVRSVFETIAQETEEDYQSLIRLLEKFNVQVLRPKINADFDSYQHNGCYIPPPMTPCDRTVMIGNQFYHTLLSRPKLYRDIADPSWPVVRQDRDLKNLPIPIQQEFALAQQQHRIQTDEYQDILNYISAQGNSIIERPIFKNANFSRASVSRIGQDLYFGTEANTDNNLAQLKIFYSELFPEYRCHVVDTQGHSDSTFCPVVPGLIVSLKDIPTYTDTFPDWEVVYLPGQSWDSVEKFLKLKDKNKGKWWVPGQELNDEFTDFVETWMQHWVGYVEETVFDVNMLVIDEHNVVCNNYNQKVFDAFARYGITPHVCNFRHRYFWDGGLHCITSDLHRQGQMKDYFPERARS